MTLGKIIRLAKSHYSAKLAYHNFGHPVKIKPIADELVERCKRYGILVDEEAIDWGVFYHDALFGADYRRLGFKTPEELSASVAASDMMSTGVPMHTILSTSQAIKATNWAVAPESVEAKILRAADLSGLAGDYLHYFDNFERLMVESGTSERLPFFFDNTRFLANYLSCRIEITPLYWDESGRSVWHDRTMYNILVNYFDSCGQAGVEAGVMLDIEPAVLYDTRKLSDLVIGIEPRDDARAAIARQANRHAQSVELLLPGNIQRVPLPNGVIDRVCMTERQLNYLDEDSKQEMARLMRHSSTPLCLKG